MFHRVKSEAAVKEKEIEVVETAEALEVEAQQQAEAAAIAAQRAQKATTSSAQAELAIEDEVDAQEEVEQEAPATPAQSLYQRTATRAGSFAPRSAGYAAPSAPSVSRTPAAETANNERRLTIGRGITMSGEIECCDELQVEGTVEAALKGAQFLNIADTGVFYGTVEIEDAVIAGRFEGEITVNGRLTVEETGVITGSISYKELEIKSGAILDGRVTPLSAQAKKA